MYNKNSWLIVNIVPKIKPIRIFFNIFLDLSSKRDNSKISNGKNRDSFQNEEWYWKIEGSSARNKIIKKQFLRGNIENIFLQKYNSAK